MVCPPYWFAATAMEICVVMVQAVRKLFGVSIRLPLMTVPFSSMSFRFIKQQLNSRCR